MKILFFEEPSFEDMSAAILHDNACPLKMPIRICAISYNLKFSPVRTLGTRYDSLDPYGVKDALTKD